MKNVCDSAHVRQSRGSFSVDFNSGFSHWTINIAQFPRGLRPKASLLNNWGGCQRKGGNDTCRGDQNNAILGIRTLITCSCSFLFFSLSLSLSFFFFFFGVFLFNAFISENIDNRPQYTWENYYYYYYWSLLYSAILRSRADSLRSHVILHEWIASFFFF